MVLILESKVCRVCRVEKSLEEFYARSGGGKDTKCKECTKTIHNNVWYPNRKGMTRNEVEADSTKYARELLLSKGIPVTSGYGKQTASFADFSYVDLVAWGCVPIEVKESAVKEKGYELQWTFRKRQQEMVFDGLYMFIIQDTKRVFIVPSQDQMIVNDAGQFKWTGLCVNLKLTQEWRRASYDRWLWLQQHENRFDFIEEYRLKISDSLRSANKGMRE